MQSISGDYKINGGYVSLSAEGREAQPFVFTLFFGGRWMLCAHTLAFICGKQGKCSRHPALLFTSAAPRAASMHSLTYPEQYNAVSSFVKYMLRSNRAAEEETVPRPQSRCLLTMVLTAGRR